MTVIFKEREAKKTDFAKLVENFTKKSKILGLVGQLFRYSKENVIYILHHSSLGHKNFDMR